MSTLVTGLEGFVGQHLLEAFPAHYFPVHGTALVEPPPIPQRDVYYHPMDITDGLSLEQLVKDVKPARVIHLAAVSNVGLSIQEPVLTFRVNVMGSVNLLESLRKYAPTSAILLVSSGEVHGNTTGTGKDGSCRETDGVAPSSPYAASKLAMELIGTSMVRSSSMDVRIARSYNHTGPGQHERFIFSYIAKTAAQIQAGIHPPRIELGNLDVQRDFLDVRDVASAYVAILDKGKSGDVYNVSCGCPRALRDMVDLLIQVSGVQVEVVLDWSRLRPGEIQILSGDCSKLSKETGWQPLRRIEDTFYEMFEGWKKRLEGG